MSSASFTDPERKRFTPRGMGLEYPAASLSRRQPVTSRPVAGVRLDAEMETYSLSSSVVLNPLV